MTSAKAGQGDREAGQNGHSLSSCTDPDAGSPEAGEPEWEADQGPRTSLVRSHRASERKQPAGTGAPASVTTKVSARLKVEDLQVILTSS